MELAFRKIRSVEDAEEMAQDIFVALYKNTGSVEDNPLLYMMGILRHKVYDYKRNPMPVILPDENFVMQQQSTVNDVMENISANELAVLLNNHVDRLPEQCRNVFLLSREQQLSNTEIADRLGISVKTVEGHITKALKFLRGHIEYSFYWFLLVSSFVYMLVMHAHW